MLNRVSLILSAVLLTAAYSGFAFDADSVFIEANTYFEAKEYSKALEKYQSLLEKEYVSAPLLYNIGNCYIKEGQFGNAILYYLKAQRLDPGDEDIESNLAFARQFMPTRLEGVKINPVTDFFDSIVSYFTLEFMAWIASVIFIIFILFLAAAVYFRYRGLLIKSLAYILLVMVIIISGLTTYKFRAEYLTLTGVIISDEADVYSAPDETGSLEFVGSFGLTFEIEKATDEYYLVMFENKRKGWIKKSEAGII